MIKLQLKWNPPSLYVGETVLVRVGKSKQSVKGKRTTLKGTCKGLILEADHDRHKYYVELKNPERTKEEKAWVKVDDLTLLTKDETKRQKMLELNNKRKSALDSDTKTQSKTQKLNNNSGVSNEVISRISSLEKLNGDTINLYFDVLRQKMGVEERNGFLSKFLLLHLA